MSDLKALPAHEGQAGIKTSTGRIFPPEAFKGVSLAELAGLVGGLDPTYGVNVVAKDGYAMTLSADQILNGEFVAYDPGTGDERKTPDPQTVILAYEREGQPIPADEDGPLRLVVISEKNNQVVDGHWSVKWVNKIELKPLGEEWDLNLTGVLDEEMDRNTFQSCSAPGCHQASWKDDQGQTWTGVPLWLLAGRVDDSIQHDGPAFFRLLAELGYSVQVIATDGYSTTIEISRLAQNDEILLANLVNGNPLPEKYFPLRVVGNGLDKKEMAGAVQSIHLVIDPAIATRAAAEAAPPTPLPTTPAPTSPPLSGSGLQVTGLVETELVLSEPDLRNLEVVEIQAEHPKQGLREYSGVRLSELLEMAAVKPDATKAIFTAGDGYSAEVNLAELQACTDCLLAFGEEPGTLVLVMPGFQSNFWVKNVARIELQ